MNLGETSARSGFTMQEVSLCSLCELVGCWYVWLEAVLLVRESPFCSLGLGRAGE